MSIGHICTHKLSMRVHTLSGCTHSIDGTDDRWHRQQMAQITVRILMPLITVPILVFNHASCACLQLVRMISTCLQLVRMPAAGAHACSWCACLWASWCRADNSTACLSRLNSALRLCNKNAPYTQLCNKNAPYTHTLSASMYVPRSLSHCPPPL